MPQFLQVLFWCFLRGMTRGMARGYGSGYDSGVWLAQAQRTDTVKNTDPYYDSCLPSLNANPAVRFSPLLLSTLLVLISHSTGPPTTSLGLTICPFSMSQIFTVLDKSQGLKNKVSCQSVWNLDRIRSCCLYAGCFKAAADRHKAHVSLAHS